MKLGRHKPIVVALLAVATAVVVYSVVRRWSAGRHAALPEYDVARLEVGAGRDAPFELVATPRTPVAIKIVAFAFAFGSGASDVEPNPVDAKTEITADGTVRLRGRGRALEGAREVRVVLGAAEDFKRYEDALDSARAGASDGQVRVLEVPIVRVSSAARVVAP